MPKANTEEKLLTPLMVGELKPDRNGETRVVRDKQAKGLRLVIYPTGKRSFLMFYRNPEGTQRKWTIGSTDAFKLADARLKVAETQAHIEKVRKGDPTGDPVKADPAAFDRASKKAVRTPVADDDKYPAVRDRFLADWQLREKPRPKTVYEKKNRLDIPGWKDKPFAKITKADVRRVLDDRLQHGKRGDREKGARRLANLTHTDLGQVWEWARYEGIITASPKDIVDWRKVRESERERLLSDDEIKAFWQATGDMSYPHGPFLRMLLLTGQRRDEVRNMRRAELEPAKRLWTVPRSRVKTDNENVLPLPEAVWAILNSLPTFEGPYLFSYSAGKTAMENHAAAKSDCLSRVEALLGRTYAEEEPDKNHGPWTLHDLRRTFSTHCNEKGLGVAVEAVLNHVQPGEAGTYNKAQYLRAKWDLLTAWAAEVERIAAGRPAESDNILPFQRPA